MNSQNVPALLLEPEDHMHSDSIQLLEPENHMS